MAESLTACMPKSLKTHTQHLAALRLPWQENLFWLKLQNQYHKVIATVFFPWMSIITTALSGKADVRQAHTNALREIIWRHSFTDMTPVIREVTPPPPPSPSKTAGSGVEMWASWSTLMGLVFATAWPRGDEGVFTAMCLPQCIAKQR